MRLDRLASLAGAAGLSVSAAAAADLVAQSRIDAVTVYPDAATVSGIADVDLPAGATTLVLHGLPMSLDPASLRVEGTAAGSLAIGSVETAVAPPDSRPPDTGIETRLRDLRGQREAWRTTIEALEAKRAMVVRYAQAGPEKLSPESGPLEITHWSAAWDMVGQALAKVGDELLAARQRAAELDEQIGGLENARQRPPTRVAAVRDIRIELEAAAPTHAQLTLSYRVAGASWRPIYDARLDTGGPGRKPALELVRRAAVTQRTGEDWRGVALAVSTVRAARGTQAPDLMAQRIVFQEPISASLQYAPAPRQVGVAPAAPQIAEAAKVRREDAGDARANNAPAEAVVATLDAGAFQASFRIPGRIDLAPDGSTRTLLIGSRQIAPELSVRATPAVDPTAFLQGHFTNDEDAPLLPGDVNIQRDGAYVGGGKLGLVAPGEAVDLGFGADDRVKITRAPVRRKENEPGWLGNTKIDTREFRSTVRNLHDFPLRATLVDQIPVSENTAIVIETLPATTPPTDKSVYDRRGVMAWTFDLQPNETREVRLSWRIKWPADRDVVLQPIPGGK